MTSSSHIYPKAAHLNRRYEHIVGFTLNLLGMQSYTFFAVWFKPRFLSHGFVLVRNNKSKKFGENTFLIRLNEKKPFTWFILP